MVFRDSAPHVYGSSQQVVCCEDLAFDFVRWAVTRRKMPIDIPKAYLNPLFLLVDRRPKAVPRSDLALAAGTSEDTLYKVVEVIRKAVGDVEAPRTLIVNVLDR